MAQSPAFCAEKESLIRAFTQAVSEYLRMQSAQLAAVIKDDSPGFEEELSAARERKNGAKLALVTHQRAHGC